jgi:hypothetical protein
VRVLLPYHVASTTAVHFVCQRKLSTSAFGSVEASFELEAPGTAAAGAMPGLPVKAPVLAAPTTASVSAAGQQVCLRFTRLAIADGAVTPVSSTVFAWVPGHSPYSILDCDVATGAIVTTSPPAQVRVCIRGVLRPSPVQRVEIVCSSACVEQNGVSLDVIDVQPLSDDSCVALSSSGRLFSTGPASVLYGSASSLATTTFKLYEAIATKLCIVKIAASSVAKHMLMLTNDGLVYAVGNGAEVRRRCCCYCC